MKKYCLALDMVDDPELIAEYEKYHQDVWPEIKQSILDSGITNMEIYRVQNRLIMIIETDESFSFERKKEMDNNNPKVQEWEGLMSKFQQQLPNSKPGEKWQLMDKVFSL
ncbi:L-rhamnose mutarotase [Chryseobacterium sp.]|uniref:L-rhamnose mutarotase n=1 Tax=Chryseobacterium sp. TaxID=1871047 RepID=UPI00289FE7F1|nr:L-rhamnose mutarotase [Chryseobacterium sp.]